MVVRLIVLMIFQKENKDMCVRAAKAIGLDICGIDICTKDIKNLY